MRNLVAEQAAIMGISVEMENSTTMFQKLIAKLSTGFPVVLLLDEYDKPILIGKKQ